MEQAALAIASHRLEQSTLEAQLMHGSMRTTELFMAEVLALRRRVHQEARQGLPGEPSCCWPAIITACRTAWQVLICCRARQHVRQGCVLQGCRQTSLCPVGWLRGSCAAGALAGPGLAVRSVW